MLKRRVNPQQQQPSSSNIYYLKEDGILLLLQKDMKYKYENVVIPFFL